MIDQDGKPRILVGCSIDIPVGPFSERRIDIPVGPFSERRIDIPVCPLPTVTKMLAFYKSCPSSRSIDF